MNQNHCLVSIKIYGEKGIHISKKKKVGEEWHGVEKGGKKRG